MSFTAPFDNVVAGDFVYGLYNGNKTIVWLEKLGCVRVMSQSSSVADAYDLNPSYSINGGGNHRIKRMSKAGLNLFLLKGRTVHFVLDGINMDQVPTKSFNSEATNTRSITGAELRWIYKHRDEQTVQDNIQFWANKKPTTPPWSPDSSNYSDQWAIYNRASRGLIDVSSVDLLGAFPDHSAVGGGNNSGCFSRLFCCFG